MSAGCASQPAKWWSCCFPPGFCRGVPPHDAGQRHAVYGAASVAHCGRWVLSGRGHTALRLALWARGSCSIVLYTAVQLIHGHAVCEQEGTQTTGFWLYLCWFSGVSPCSSMIPLALYGCASRVSHYRRDFAPSGWSIACETHHQVHPTIIPSLVCLLRWHL